MTRLGALIDTYERLVWTDDIDTLPRLRRIPVFAVRIVLALIGDFRDGDITLRAMGLVYTTLVSLVPLLALAFSLLKAFGVDNALRPTLMRFLRPLGAGSTQIVDKITDFVANVQVGVLGAIGIVALIYSVLSLIQKVEAGCNFIWRVRRERPLGRRITEYISVLVVGPLVILAAASITASLRSNTTLTWLSGFEVFGSILYGVGLVLPYVLYSIAFTLLFKFIPNTRVFVLPALGGGIFSGVLWQTASTAFALFAASGGNVNAIYSSFAILILLLIWLYVSWMILLLGCRVAFYLQHPERLTHGEYPPRLGAAEAERLCLLAACEIAARFNRGRPPTDISQLAHDLRAAPEHMQTAIDRLLAAGVLVETVNENKRTTVVPARAIGATRVADIVALMRTGSLEARLAPRDGVDAAPVDALLARAEAARADVFEQLTLADLVARQDAGRTASEPHKPLENG